MNRPVCKHADFRSKTGNTGISGIRSAFAGSTASNSGCFTGSSGQPCAMFPTSDAVVAGRHTSGFRHYTGSRLNSKAHPSLGCHERLSMGSLRATDGISFGLGPCESATHNHPDSFSSSTQRRSATGVGSGSCDPAAKESHFSSLERELTRLLQPSVCGNQENRRFPTCAQSVTSEQILETHPVPHGHASRSPKQLTFERLDSVDRPERRLLPCPDSHPGPEVAEIPLERNCVPVQCSSVRTQPIPLGLHSSSQGTSEVGPCAGDSNVGVHRRLARHVSGKRAMCLPITVDSSSGTDFGISCSSRQVRLCAETAVSPSGNALRHSSLDSQTCPGKGDQSDVTASTPMRSTHSHSTRGCFRSGSHGVNGHAAASRPCAQESASASTSPALQSVSGLLEESAYSHGLVSDCSQPVVRHLLDHSVSANHDAPTLSRSLCRRLSSGLGSSHFRSCRQRPLVGTGSGSPHQHAGTQSSVQSTTELPRQHFRSCSSQIRQPDCCGVDFPSRGNTFRHSLHGNGENSDVGSPAGLASIGSTPQRQFERVSRSAEQTRFSHSNRMDSGSPGARTSVATVGQANAGPVCHTSQQASSGLCLPSSGRQGLGSRRSESQLEESGRLRVSSFLHGTAGHSQSDPRRTQTHSCHSLLAVDVLVSQATSACSRSPAPTSGGHSGSKPATLGSSAQKPTGSKPSRLASVRESLQSTGLSEDAIDCALSAQRDSTKQVYQNHWSKWLLWCRRNNVVPLLPSSADVANHLAYLAKHRKLSVAYLRVRRAAISSTLTSAGYINVTDSPVITNVLRGISLSQARLRSRIPKWDIRPVLQYLLSSAFEPLERAPLKALTHKTCFLIALASGRRASEILNLSGIPGEVAYEPDGTASLVFLPEFLAKNQHPEHPSPHVTIKPLTGFVSSSDRDALNCPVRALRLYRKRTRAIRSPGQRALFLSFNENMTKDIRVGTISRWLRDLIVLSYKCMESSDLSPHGLIPLARPNAHEVRAWASTLAFRSVSLPQLLSAAYWRSEDVFTSFYLRDVARRKEDGSWGLPSVVAAQVPLRHVSHS